MESEACNYGDAISSEPTSSCTKSDQDGNPFALVFLSGLAEKLLVGDFGGHLLEERLQLMKVLKSRFQGLGTLPHRLARCFRLTGGRVPLPCLIPRLRRLLHLRLRIVPMVFAVVARSSLCIGVLSRHPGGMVGYLGGPGWLARRGFPA